MTATLELNLSDALTADELRELTAEAVEQHKPIERVLLDAAREVARRRKELTAPGNGPGKSPAMAA